MIELTREQAEALKAQTEPMEVQLPGTREVFVLVRKEVFDQMRQWMAPLAAGWDDPRMDVYNEPVA